MKKIIQSILVLCAFLLAGYSANLRAEDIDIYVDNSGTGGAPNVLFVFDNGANFDASVPGAGCPFYPGTTTAPSMGSGKAAGILQCALVNALMSLPDGAMNIGILMSNDGTFAKDTRSTSDAAFHETCAGSTGGCVLRKLTLMTSSNKASLISFIKSWNAQGNNSGPNDFSVKVNTATPATMMQEAWAYFNGKTGLSGVTYPTSFLATGCQRNFVIYIANTDKKPANESNPSPQAALAAPQTGSTTAQQSSITDDIVFDPPMCATTRITGGTENWADEWARFMFQQDGGTSDQAGTQNIITYTIGMVNATCTVETAALLSNMAKFGGGKFFTASGVNDLADALGAILNEVQAVNSVFSSASLPVSVNAEGSYLNQIFLGMFRPDSSGLPRWMGNLKQYQLIRNNSGALVMGDNAKPKPQPAISSAGTGFLSPTAISFWTTKDTTKSPDSLGGFFKNAPIGTPASPFDSPDGEVVEKGGVAQQLRLENLTSTFTGAGGSTGNPRRLYTWCPSGSPTCNKSLKHSDNDFSTANTNIGTKAFGETTSIPVASVSRSGSTSTATVTTSSNHGLSTGDTVTISGVIPAAFNLTQSITVTGTKTFTITGIPTYPTSPSQGTFSLTPGASSVQVNSITRTTSTINGVSTETATVTTNVAHGITTATDIVVSGATPSAYNYSGKPASVPTATTFTFPITIDPPPTNANTYRVAFTPVSPRSVTMSRSSATVTVSLNAHGYFLGQSIVIAGAGSCNGTFKVASVANNGKSFTYNLPSVPSPVTGCSSGTVTVDTTPITISPSAITRPTTSPGTATAIIGTSNWFGTANGNTATVDITQLSGTATNESAFLASKTTLTCKNSGCTQFSYGIAVTATSATAASTSGMTVSKPSTVVNLTTPLSRDSTGVVTVTGVPSGVFTNGSYVIVSATGTPRSDESGYTGYYPITCTVSGCTSFTYGPVPLTPSSGSGGVVFAQVPANRDMLIKWVRGADNQDDEDGPGGGVTVRGSIHGDVLHSRPLVVNYGDSRGIVVFYGANDGVFHAVNGNTENAIGAVPAGGELWGLVLPEHYTNLSRLRTNSPELKFPSSFLSTAQPKDYFVDGPTGVYQKLKADGTIDKAYLFLTMRRGGRFIYALDVSTPTDPKFLWRKSASDPGFEELGQTWSRPRLTLLQNYTETVSGVTTKPPVLVFGAGYDPAEDLEPPESDTMGRGIFVINAETGALIWSANATCTTGATCRNVPNMAYAIPSEVAFVDRDNNGYADKFYFGDTGGNLWRADVSDAVPANWKVTRVAALGCDTASGGPVDGACPSGTTPRKFFYPPSVLTVRGAGATDSYDAVSIASGDREHPLKSTVPGSAYLTKDRFFMIKDLGTTVGAPSGAPSSVDITAASTSLVDATSGLYNGTLNGFFFALAVGEKAVNAPLAVNGQVFFSTNRPIDPTKTCASNLGEAKAYAVSPFDGSKASNVLQGGGLPPSAVSGLVAIESTDSSGNKTTTLEKFCIGCGISGSDNNGNNTAPCTSALENCNAGKAIAKNLRRTYWYKK